MVLRRDTTTSRKVRWMCRCDCGNIISILDFTLTSGKSASCCGRKINILGHRFGKLTVIELLPERGEGQKWLCKCDCGNRQIARHIRVTKRKSAKLRMLGWPDQKRERVVHRFTVSTTESWPVVDNGLIKKILIAECIRGKSPLTVLQTNKHAICSTLHFWACPRWHQRQNPGPQL